MEGGAMRGLFTAGVIDVMMENDIEYDEILAGPGNKKEKCLKHNIDIMIEDKANNVEEISEHIPVLCFDAPYNLKVNKDNVHRVYSWFQIYKYFLDKSWTNKI